MDNDDAWSMSETPESSSTSDTSEDDNLSMANGTETGQSNGWGKVPSWLGGGQASRPSSSHGKTGKSDGGYDKSGKKGSGWSDAWVPTSHSGDGSGKSGKGTGRSESSADNSGNVNAFSISLDGPTSHKPKTPKYSLSNDSFYSKSGKNSKKSKAKPASMDSSIGEPPETVIGKASKGFKTSKETLSFSYSNDDPEIDTHLRKSGKSSKSQVAGFADGAKPKAVKVQSNVKPKAAKVSQEEFEGTSHNAEPASIYTTQAKSGKGSKHSKGSASFSYSKEEPDIDTHSGKSGKGSKSSTSDEKVNHVTSKASKSPDFESVDNVKPKAFKAGKSSKGSKVKAFKAGKSSKGSKISISFSYDISNSKSGKSDFGNGISNLEAGNFSNSTPGPGKSSSLEENSEPEVIEPGHRIHGTTSSSASKPVTYEKPAAAGRSDSQEKPSTSMSTSSSEKSESLPNQTTSSSNSANSSEISVPGKRKKKNISPPIGESDTEPSLTPGTMSNIKQSEGLVEGITFTGYRQKTEGSETNVEDSTESAAMPFHLSRILLSVVAMLSFSIL